MERKGFFSRLKDGLSKTRKNITEKMDQLFKYHNEVDDELFDELEELLILADVGVSTTTKLMEKIRERVKAERIREAQRVRDILKEEIIAILGDQEEFDPSYPAVFLVVGVNGVGKTTTIGKLAHMYQKQGKRVLMAAGDTFRAAAIEQLEIWANRVGCQLVRHTEGSDAAAVVFDAVQAAKSRGIDVLICDTAGRLHTKKNLMNELEKINRIIDREYPEAHKEVFLVLDATTGQNAVSQAKMFKEKVDVTGIILTKLDGTAKGGIIIAIKSELGIPIRFIGVGEGLDDLQRFDAQAFVEALFDEA
ncbi:MAG: signal recognition particle-docking protein FtsY [Caldicoprobacter oshimai]|uniref:Signal recognition particle receptor FtsY n=1 Tax=Caldicoprobacter faecalis TaxID=937334 RepID=A0A1I5U3D6_9FIRM|nr:signal recognition particle-docking protein FtsY [Caldicoprobacter faecalis]PZN10916.1 MAG: signal recognition particle-docking protein FtsY [Caldicoprobacter oshimai]SFP89780.1 fused signal recognition particle receptor [Caldicoprobacter faecalis]